MAGGSYEGQRGISIRIAILCKFLERMSLLLVNTSVNVKYMFNGTHTLVCILSNLCDLRSQGLL